MYKRYAYNDLFFFQNRGCIRMWHHNSMPIGLVFTANIYSWHWETRALHWTHQQEQGHSILSCVATPYLLMSRIGRHRHISTQWEHQCGDDHPLPRAAPERAEQAHGVLQTINAAAIRGPNEVNDESDILYPLECSSDITLWIRALWCYRFAFTPDNWEN